MRSFSAAYLEETRSGMWEDRRALRDLELAARDRILEVGCGTGSFTRVLCEDSSATVIAVDADPGLLDHTESGDRLVGDAYRLPLRSDAVDLVVCQALLVNLPDPRTVLREFLRVSAGGIAAIEPDNAGVSIDSTVRAEPAVTRAAREAYIDGIETDVTLGSDVEAVFRSLDITEISTRRYEFTRRVTPPYSSDELYGAIRKATGARLADHRDTLLNGELSESEYGELRSRWRSMGRTAVRQMQSGDYERTETVPFYVTVGRI